MHYVVFKIGIKIYINLMCAPEGQRESNISGDEILGRESNLLSSIVFLKSSVDISKDYIVD